MYNFELKNGFQNFLYSKQVWGLVNISWLLHGLKPFLHGPMGPKDPSVHVKTASVQYNN